jgi:hypothetical protein
MLNGDVLPVIHRPDIGLFESLSRQIPAAPGTWYASGAGVKFAGNTFKLSRACRLPL